MYLNLRDEGCPTRQFVTKGNATICIRQKQYINKRIPQTKVSEKDRSLENNKILIVIMEKVGRKKRSPSMRNCSAKEREFICVFNGLLVITLKGTVMVPVIAQ